MISSKSMISSIVILLSILHSNNGEAWRTRASKNLATTAPVPVQPPTTTGQRYARYARFDPPKIYPISDSQTVKAGSQHTIRCEGRGRKVAWRIPTDTSSDLTDRITLHSEAQDSDIYMTELTIRDLVYRDTGTFTCAFEGTKDLTSIDNSTSVHLYVDDGVHLLKNTGFDFYKASQSDTFIFPCMPTHPDVNVTLWKVENSVKQIHPDHYISFDPKVGFRISPVMSKLHMGSYSCKATYRGREETFMLDFTVLTKTAFVPMPVIDNSQARHVRIGDTFTLTCSVNTEFNVIVELNWNPPNSQAIKERRVDHPDTISRNLSLAPGINYKKVEQGLTVRKASLDDQGLYECTVVDHSKNKQTKSEFVRVLEKEEPYIKISFDAYQTLDITLGQNDEKPIQWVVDFSAHPEPSVEWYDPRGMRIDPSVNPDFEIQTTPGLKAKTMLRVVKPSLSKSGNYMVKVFSENVTATENFTLIVRSKPTVNVRVVNQQDLYQVGMEYTLKCSAEGFPVPEIRWMFKPCSSFEDSDCDNSQLRHLQSIDIRKPSSFNRESTLKVIAKRSGRIICQACSSTDCPFDQVPFFVTDVPNGGFAVDGPKRIMVGEPLKLRCSASVYNYSENSLEWYKDSLQGPTLLQPNGNNFYKISQFSTELSFGKEISFENASLVDRGNYICRVTGKYLPYHNEPESLKYPKPYDYIEGQRFSQVSKPKQAAQRELTFYVEVLPLEAPTILDSNLFGDDILVVETPSNGLTLRCRTNGRPKPKVKWYLFGSPVQIAPNLTRVKILENGEVLQINYVTDEDEGLYECRAENKAGIAKASKYVQLLESVKKDSQYANFSIPVVVVVGIALCLVAILIAFAKWFYHRRGKWRENSLPKTPRLTQYELPQNREEEDECRMTLTSSITRDGSISPNENGHFGSHLMSLSSPCQEPCHCHSHIHQPCHLGPSVLVPQCSICEYSFQTLPLHRMNSIQSRNNTLRRYDPYKSRSQSPRLSAEF